MLCDTNGGSLAGQVGVAWRNAQQAEKLMVAREQQRELAIAKNIQLGLLPRMNILHTSVRDTGQIYVPFVNWGLYVFIVLRHDRRQVVHFNVTDQP